MKVVFMRGLSASGKSTYAKKLAEDSDFVRVNMDDIRAMLGAPFTRANDALALEVQKGTVLAALRVGRDVVVDNLHLHSKWPRKLADAIVGAGFDVDYSIVDFSDVPLETCIERNALRSGPITEGIIRQQAKQFDDLRNKGLWTVEDLLT